ncbi:MAG: PAS domain S-box protein, partial [Chitinophagaceae bacterium]
AGTIAIVSWFSDNQYTSSFFASIASTKFISSLSLILCAISLYSVNTLPGSRFDRTIGKGAAYGVIVICALSIIELVTNIPVSPDRLFIGFSKRSYAGTMEIFASLLFLLLAIVLIKLRRTGSHILVQVLLPVVFFPAVFITFNYISGLDYLGSIPFAVTTALTTSLGIMLVCVGIFFSRPLQNLSFSYERKIAAYFAVAILLLGIVFFSISANNQKLLQSSKMVDRTSKVLLKTNVILTEAQDIETGARGFIITSDEQFLEPYHRSSVSIIYSIDTLRALTAEAPVQQVLVDTLLSLAKQNIVLRGRLIEMKRAGLEGQLLTIMAIGAEKKLMDNMRQVIRNIQTAEQRRLQARMDINTITARGSQRIISVIEVLVTLLIIIVAIIVYRNTLSRNRAEAALRKSEAFARSIIDNAAGAITIKDAEGRYMMVNHAAQQLIGLPEHQILGKYVRDFFPDIDVGLESSDRAVLENKNRVESTSSVKIGDKTVHMLTTRFPLFDENNQVYGLCSMSTDITPIKEAQEVIEAAHRQQHLMLNGLQNLLEASLDIICVINEDGQYNQVSANCPDLFGYEASDLIGKHYTEFMYPEDIAYSLSCLKEIVAGTTVRDCENRYIKKDGSLVPLLWTVIWSPENKMFYAIIKDATEKKLTAQQLTELNAQLSKRANELMASNTELEQFAYVASHDLQEPLRMVTSFLQLLEKRLEGALDETNKKYIAFAVDGAERMKTLIQDLLQYSRIGTSKEMVVTVDCNEVLRSVRNIFELSIRETNADLVIHPLPVIKGERAQIHQLFQNLIGNAIKYSQPAAPKIEVGFNEVDNNWVFYVKDQGVGINPKFFDKIFIIFQRLHNRSDFSGTGIGLAICKKIVERHGGSIWVESEQGQGSTFFVRLPK